MNKTHLLGAARLGVLGLSQTAMAQNYDDRWYVSGTLGMLNTDNDRGIGNTMPTYGVGVGKFVAPRFSVDLEVDRMSFNRSFLDWDLTGLALIGRYHFIQLKRAELSPTRCRRHRSPALCRASSSGDINLFHRPTTQRCIEQIPAKCCVHSDPPTP